MRSPSTSVHVPITVISTVTGKVLPGVGVIPPIHTVVVEPGKQQTVPVYVWNRGTRNANVSIEPLGSSK